MYITVLSRSDSRLGSSDLLLGAPIPNDTTSEVPTPSQTIREPLQPIIEDLSAVGAPLDVPPVPPGQLASPDRNAPRYRRKIAVSILLVPSQCKHSLY